MAKVAIHLTDEEYIKLSKDASERGLTIQEAMSRDAPLPQRNRKSSRERCALYSKKVVKGERKVIPFSGTIGTKKDRFTDD